MSAADKQPAAMRAGQLVRAAQLRPLESLFDSKQTLRQNRSDSAKIISMLATRADVGVKRGSSSSVAAGEKIADAVFGAGIKLGHPLRGLGADTLRDIARKYYVDAAQRIRLRRRSGGPHYLHKELGRPVGIADDVAARFRVDDGQDNARTAYGDRDEYALFGVEVEMLLRETWEGGGGINAQKQSVKAVVNRARLVRRDYAEHFD